MSRRYRKSNVRGFISTMSYLVRQFILPNPFANIFENPDILILLISKFISDIYWIIGVFVVVYLILCFIEGWLLDRNNSIF